MGSPGRILRPLVLLAVTFLGGACSSATQPLATPPLSPSLIAAFNALYAEQRPVTVMKVAPTGASPAVSEASAISEAKVSCNDGPDPTVVGAGLMTVTGMEHPVWAVFLNPPGTHYLPNGAGTGGVTANWYVVLVGNGPGPPGCSVGFDFRLRPLPVHH